MNRTLSDDVRLVIDTLGFVIRAKAGDDVFAAVEAVRMAAKDARDPDAAEGGQAARTKLAEIVGRLDAATALEVARAFTLYFQLVNLAEDAHRTRELRRSEDEGGAASVRDSIHGALEAIAKAGTTREQACRRSPTSGSISCLRRTPPKRVARPPNTSSQTWRTCSGAATGST